MQTSTPLNIAIDGPGGAGKGTVSRMVADQLGLLYVDTGAMYRCAAYLAINNDLDPDADQDRIVELTKQSQIELQKVTPETDDGRLITVILNDEDVSHQIRLTKVSQMVPLVARIPEVRHVLVEKQQQIAAAQPVIMEGRDITYRVLPDASLKIFLTASPEERADRRFKQLQSQGKLDTYEEVLADVVERDRIDTTRDTDPLRDDVEGMIIINTDQMTIDDVVDKVIELAQQATTE